MIANVHASDRTYSLDEIAAHAAASGNDDLAARARGYSRQRRAERRERGAAIAVTGIGAALTISALAPYAVAALVR